MTTNIDKMYCSNCHTEIPPDSRFCPYCGKIIEVHADILLTGNDIEAPSEIDSNNNVASYEYSEKIAKNLTVGIIEGRKIVEDNSESQPQNELDTEIIKKCKKNLIIGAIIAAVIILISVLIAIRAGMVTYFWYDADGVILFEETISKNATPTAYALPADTDKWRYTEWANGDNVNEKIAQREPQHTYFAGNVFQIVIKDLGGQPVSTGSAFVFNEDGWFITNAHVMEDAYYAEAIFDIPNNQTGESYTYLSINSGTYYHLDKDIYVGKVYNYASIKSHYHEISIQMNYEIGEKTYSVGYPNSSAELMIKEGTVTETWSDIYEKLYNGHKYICSSSYIAPGSSGGILTNADLEVIGITTLGWMDMNDQFISGASISSFNFNQFLDNTNEKNLKALIDRFHADEKVYIGYFNEAKRDATIGDAEEFYFDDGTLAYIYEWEDEGVNVDGDAYSYTESLLVGSDGWMSYNEEYYWGGGDRRVISFYGYYDHQKGFANFKFSFEYEWSNGKWYSVKCSNINYSSNLSLTLNRCVVDSSYSLTPSDDNIEYAKEAFNRLYEWLTEDMARFK